MENNWNNDWYENNSGVPNDSNNHNAQYNTWTAQQAAFEKTKRKRGVTTGALIICMTMMLSLGLLGGAVLMYFNPVRTDAETEKERNAMVVDEPNGEVDETMPSGATEAAPAVSGDDTPSDNLNVTAPSVADGYSDTAEMIRSIMTSVVGITVEGAQNTYYGQTETADTGSGSGVIITQDGYIVTNNHVIDGASGIRVYLQDGTEYRAELVATDSISDLALIKIEAVSLPAATLGNSGEMLVGDNVYAVGNPLGVLQGSVSSGIISGLDRTIEVEGVTMTLMQTDAAVNPGNSGGGLFDSNGRLIGIVNCKSYGEEIEGLGFAIPIDSALPVIRDLMDVGFVTGRPYLGISLQHVMATYGGQNGFGGYGGYSGYGGQNYMTRVQVVAVEAGSSAEKAGIQAGDLILAIDGTDIYNSTELSNALNEYSVGDKVTIKVQRDGEQLELELTLGERTAV